MHLLQFNHLDELTVELVCLLVLMTQPCKVILQEQHYYNMGKLVEVNSSTVSYKRPEWHGIAKEVWQWKEATSHSTTVEILASIF